jgi:flagellar hook protein FlgE
LGTAYVKQNTKIFNEGEITSNTKKELELFIDGGGEIFFSDEIRARIGYQYVDYADIKKVYLNIVWDF